MPFRFRDRRVTKIAELLEFLDMDQKLLAQGSNEGDGERQAVVWYRGVPSTQLSLTPSLHWRKIPVHDEAYLMNRFMQNAYEFIEQRPQGEWEWMLLARHHGLPSRLLDWTENALVGLFFACNGHNPIHSNRRGILWCLSPSHLNDMASNGTLRSDIRPMFKDVDPRSVEDEFLDIYSMATVTLPMAPVPPAAAISVRTNKRIQSQSGVFTIHHADTTPIENVGDGSHLWRYIIPTNVKCSIRKELRSTGITPLTLFPELDNVAQEAMRGF